MDEQEAKRQLEILIELSLYSIIESIRSERKSDKNQKIKKAIEDFKENLPEGLKNVPDINNFIILKIKEMDKEMEQLRKMREEEKFER